MGLLTKKVHQMPPKKTISILYVISGLQVGGTENHLVQLLTELVNEGIEPTVFSFEGKGPMSTPLREAGVRLVYPPFPSLFRIFPGKFIKALFFFFGVFSLLKFILKNRPIIIHMFLPAAYMFGGIAALIGRVPIKIMSRRSRNHYQKKYPFVQALEKILHKRMTLLIGNSLKVTEDLIKEARNKEQIRTLYNGVKIKKLISNEDRFRLRSKLGICPETVVFIMTANLITYKGHQFLLESLALVKDELGENWALFALGESRGNLKNLREFAERLGLGKKVHWLGLKEDVRHFLLASDVGILCSYEEGFSNSILEYMEAGLPAIVTNVGGNAEAVVDGKTGLVVESKNCESLSAAVLALQRNQKRRVKMGNLARKRVSNLFNQKRAKRNYLDMYSELVEQLQET